MKRNASFFLPLLAGFCSLFHCILFLIEKRVYNVTRSFCMATNKSYFWSSICQLQRKENINEFISQHIQIDWWHKDKHGFSYSTVFKLCAIDRKLNNLTLITKQEFSSDIYLSMHDTVTHGKSNFSSRELKCHKSERQ